MKRLPLTLLFLLVFSKIYAQNAYSISGKVVDQKKQPISIGDVFLFQNDSIVKYTTIIDGEFSFEGILKNTYFLKISSLGYLPYEENIDLTNRTEITAFLLEDITNLDIIEITANKRIIENKNGNIIVNVENTILSKESNTVDLLSKLPKIQIATDRESINIIGKGTALIYLGNQRISVQELKNMTIEDIKSIEIINSPSSKYEAEGRGVILINPKFTNKNGIKGTLTETASFRKNFNSFFASKVSFKKEKLEFKFNAGYNHLSPWESNGSDYVITNENIESSYLVAVDKTKRPQFILGGGFYYQINMDDYFSLSSTLRSQKDEFLIKTNSKNKENNLEDHIFTLSDNEDYRFYSSTNVNYNKSFKKKGNLFIGGQYSFFNKELGSNIANNSNNAGIITIQKRLQNFKVNVLSLKADFEREFKNKYTLEIGTSTTAINATTSADISILNPTTNTISNYGYKENNYAAYTQLSGKTGKFSFTTGVRVETTDSKGGFLSKNTLLIDRNNIKLFPKAMLNFEIDSTKNLTLNYAKSIVRPNFTNISSISTYINPYLEFNRNIELKPTITNEMSLNYDFKKYSISTSYFRKENPVFYTIAYNNISRISTMSPTNFEKEEGLSLEFVVPLKHKFWSSTTVINFATNKVSDKNAIVFKANPYLYIYTNHQFKINNTSSFNLSGWGLTNRNEGIFDRKGVYAINASLNKEFLKKTTITLSFNDIFKSLQYEESYHVNNILANTIYYTDVNEVSISIKYSFGKLKKSSFKNKNVDKNLSRIR